jgi:hypothetical protein
LRVLKLRNRDYITSHLSQREFTIRLSTLLSLHLHDLEVLDIPCLVRSISIDAIAKSRNLRTLRLRDFSETEKFLMENAAGVSSSSKMDTFRSNVSSHSERHWLPTLSPDDLSLIQKYCPLVADSDLGFDTEQSEVRPLNFPFAAHPHTVRLHFLFLLMNLAPQDFGYYYSIPISTQLDAANPNNLPSTWTQEIWYRPRS